MGQFVNLYACNWSFTIGSVKNNMKNMTLRLDVNQYHSFTTLGQDSDPVSNGSPKNKQLHREL